MITIPKGTKDVLPEESYKWHAIESIIRETTRLFDFKEIRTPTFEHTELFLRGVGDSTDIVNKEMYTFIDKGGRSITLKPEGTAGVARAFIENGLQQKLPMRSYYITPVFRYEKPQAGRLREHHQFGVELYGAEGADADVEVISIARTLFKKIGLDPVLYINSIGCSTCRKDYHKALIDYLAGNAESLCETCRERLKTNPLRVLDCKVPTCKEVLKNAPSVLDYLCEDCSKHHSDLKSKLSNLGISYIENPKIVRGLDYYTRTVFEFVATGLGSQDTVCGGGRYNGLVESIGGKPCPAVGFGMGLERLLLTIENNGIELENNEVPDLFVCSMGEKAFVEKLIYSLRENGVSVIGDYGERSLKAQMKSADRSGARYSMVIGEDEVKAGLGKLKNMKTAEVISASFEEIHEILKRR